MENEKSVFSCWFVVLVFFRVFALCFDGTLYNFLIYIVSLSLIGKKKKITSPQLRELLRWPRPLPLEDEHVRLLREVGFELERSFDGKASNLVLAMHGKV
jgi:hypothetical protein